MVPIGVVAVWKRVRDDDGERRQESEGERGRERYEIVDSLLLENENGARERHCRCWIEEDEVKWFNDDN